jgi:hypothetical protein
MAIAMDLLDAIRPPVVVLHDDAMIGLNFPEYKRPKEVRMRVWRALAEPVFTPGTPPTWYGRRGFQVATCKEIETPRSGPITQDQRTYEQAIAALRSVDLDHALAEHRDFVKLTSHPRSETVADWNRCYDAYRATRRAAGMPGNGTLSELCIWVNAQVLGAKSRSDALPFERAMHFIHSVLLTPAPYPDGSALQRAFSVLERTHVFVRRYA